MTIIFSSSLSSSSIIFSLLQHLQVVVVTSHRQDSRGRLLPLAQQQGSHPDCEETTTAQQASFLAPTTSWHIING
jgi:hypothetical protein